MDKYISCEAAYKFMFDIPNPDGAGEIEVVSIDDLDTIPAADVTLVRHGQWIAWGRGGHKICSYCKRSCTVNVIIGNPNYCPNCGAKMDGEP